MKKLTFKVIYLLFCIFSFPIFGQDVLLVTVADDRSGRKAGKYVETQKKIEALFRNNPKFGITKFNMWTFDDIVKTEFYKQHQVLLDNQYADINGRVYKPFAIYEGLKSLKEGDYLIYTDSSPELWSSFNPKSRLSDKYNIDILKKLCQNNQDVLTAWVLWNDTPPQNPRRFGDHTHAHFTLDRCMRKMDLFDYRDSLQHASGMIILRKSERSVNFVKEWLYWNTVEECAGLGWADKNRDTTFWEEEYTYKYGHRHDQSISGLLINRMNNKLVLPPNDPNGFHSYNFLQYARKDVSYQFIDSNITNPKFQK